MRGSSEKLPAGSETLRLHLDESDDYIESVTLKPLTLYCCELSGFHGKITLEILRIAFSMCAKSGYKYCYIERRKKQKTLRKKFNLSRYV